MDILERKVHREDGKDIFERKKRIYAEEVKFIFEKEERVFFKGRKGYSGEEGKGILDRKEEKL
jgi:hypothetical protein